MTPEDVGVLLGCVLSLSAIIGALATGTRGPGLLARLISPAAIVGALRLAKPGSWWYEKYHEHAERKPAWERYERTPHVEAVG
jgi:hypothetical protein